jgi:hypothetical protein
LAAFSPFAIGGDAVLAVAAEIVNNVGIANAVASDRVVQLIERLRMTLSSFSR